MSTNGKGSRPRNNMSEAFRANYEAIKWQSATHIPTKPSKRAKSQGNGLKRAIVKP